jgi:hypothetical protein
LDLVLPTAQISEHHVSDSNTIAVGRHYPTTLAHWNDFQQYACLYKLDNGEVLVDLPQVPRSIADESDIWAALRLNVCPLINAVQSVTIEKTAHAPRTNKSRRIVVGEPDFAAWKNLSTLGVLEAKSPWTLKYMPDSGKTIAENYADNSLNVHVRRAIAQIVGYLIDNAICYGALTTYNKTWFVRTIDGDTVYVSDAIPASQKSEPHYPTFLRCLAYFLNLADNGSPLNVAGRLLLGQRRSTGGEWREKQPPKNPASDRKGTDKPDPSPPTPQGAVGSNTKNVTHMHAPDLAFDSLGPITFLSKGKSASVGELTLNGTVIALKMFDCSQHKELDFYRELHMYSLLKDLQGKAVPELLFTSSSPSGQVQCLGLTFGKQMPPDFSSWSTVQKQQALAALQMLADRSLVQNDLCTENFVEIDGRVLVIDLEDVGEKLDVVNYMDTVRREMFFKSA